MNENNETSLAKSEPGNFYSVFRHKRKITITTLIGLMAAAIFCVARQPPYQSEAKIFIRYAESAGRLHQNEVMDVEMAILTSVNSVAKVATNIGPEKILAGIGGGNNLATAVGALKSHIKTEGIMGNRVIHVTFCHPNAALVQPVLSEIIAVDLDAHSVTCCDSQISDELQEKMKQLRLEFAQTEDEAQMAKTNSADTNAAAAKIADLERRKKVQQANYEFYVTLLEQSRIDKRLSKRNSAFQEIQNPTPPFRDFAGFYRTISLLVFGGPLAGLGWAGLAHSFRGRQV